VCIYNHRSEFIKLEKFSSPAYPLVIAAKTGPGEEILIKISTIIKRGKKRIRKNTDPIISMDLFTISNLTILFLLAPEIIQGRKL